MMKDMMGGMGNNGAESMGGMGAPDQMLGAKAQLSQQLAAANPFGNPVLDSPSMEDMLPHLASGMGSEACPSCGQAPCVCDQMNMGGDQGSPEAMQDGNMAINAQGEEFLPEDAKALMQRARARYEASKSFQARKE